MTWLIPVLNGMPYLPIALESVRSQTYTNHEVHVWDNGSTDGTIEELNRWIPDRLPGRIITGNPLPLGICLAHLVEQASTEFCARFDADDINTPDRLERQIRYMAENPQVAGVGAQTNQLDSAGNDLGPFTDHPLDHDSIVQTMLLTNPLAHPVVLFRRSAILDAGNYHDFSPTHVEDYDMWLRLAAKGHRLANLPVSLLKYRVHDKSSTQKSLVANRLQAEILRRLCDVAPTLFGVDGQTLLQLRTRTQPHAIVPLRQIARRIADRNNPWESPIFYRAARSMIADLDVRSRIGAAYEHRGVAGATSELKAIGGNAVRFLSRRIGLGSK